MDQYEQAVLDYLCGRPERFVNAQYTIPYTGLTGGSCPDFVVLDFADTTIYVIEVTAAADTKGLMRRVRERETRWYDPLRSHFTRLNDVVFAAWDYHVTIFVRDEEVEDARLAITEFRDVSVISLSRAVFSWNWDWQRDTGLPINVLRDPTKLARAK